MAGGGGAGWPHWWRAAASVAGWGAQWHMRHIVSTEVSSAATVLLVGVAVGVAAASADRPRHVTVTHAQAQTGQTLSVCQER